MSHKTLSISRLTSLFSGVAIAVLLVGPGCFHPPEDELTNGVVAGERPVAMEGTGAFFAGRVVAKVTLSRGIGKGIKRGKGDRDKTYQDYADNKDKTVIGSPLPPVTLHLLLTNTGPDPVTVEMVDFVSELGNFALDPDKLTIGAGATAEPTSMVSQLGVSSDVMPFKVTLRIGKAKESQTVQVRIVHPAGDMPAAK